MPYLWSLVTSRFKRKGLGTKQEEENPCLDVCVVRGSWLEWGEKKGQWFCDSGKARAAHVPTLWHRALCSIWSAPCHVPMCCSCAGMSWRRGPCSTVQFVLHFRAVTAITAIVIERINFLRHRHVLCWKSPCTQQLRNKQTNWRNRFRPNTKFNNSPCTQELHRQHMLVNSLPLQHFHFYCSKNNLNCYFHV